MSAPERRKPEQDRRMNERKKKEIELKRGKNSNTYTWKCSKTEVPKAKHCLTEPKLRKRTNSPYDLKWNSRFSLVTVSLSLFFPPFYVSLLQFRYQPSITASTADLQYTQSRADHIKSRKPKQSKRTKWNHELIILEDNTAEKKRRSIYQNMGEHFSHGVRSPWCSQGKFHKCY